MTTHNITDAPNRPFKDRAKDKIKEHKTKILAVGVGAGALATAFFAGKSKGESNFEIDLFLVPDPSKPEDASLSSSVTSTKQSKK